MLVNIGEMYSWAGTLSKMWHASRQKCVPHVMHTYTPILRALNNVAPYHVLDAHVEKNDQAHATFNHGIHSNW